VFRRGVSTMIGAGSDHSISIESMA
jgi:hypothetical protein